MGKRLRIKDFSGGLNTEGQNFFMEDNEAVECRNVNFDKQGAIIKRNGYKALLDSTIGADGIKGLHIFHEKNGDRHMITATRTGLYEIDESAGTYSTLETGLTAEEHYSFATLLDKCFIANGKDGLRIYDGENIDINPNAPNGKFVIANNNKLYIAGDEENPNRLYYTVIDDNGLLEWWETSNQNGESFTADHDNWIYLDNAPIQYNSEYIASYERGIDYEVDYTEGRIKTLSTGNMTDSQAYSIDYSYKYGLTHYIDVNSNDGDIITAITRQQGNIVIFKSSSIYTLYGTDQQNYQLRNVQPNIGCIAPNSVVNIFNYLYFLYRDGIYTFDGSSVDLISEKIGEKINEIADPSKVSGAWYDHKYYLSYPKNGSSTNNIILVYNLMHESWSYYTGVNAGVFNNFDGSQDGQVNIGEIYFGDSNEGQVHQFDTGTDDNGDPIDMRYSTKHFELDGEDVIKTFRKIMASAISQGEVKLDYSIDKGRKSGTFEIAGYDTNQDYKWGSTTWGNLIWNKPAIFKFGTSFPGGSHGGTISFTIRDNSTNNVKFYGLTAKVRGKREAYWR